MLIAERWQRTWIYLSILLSYAHAARPRFDISTDMGMVLVPMDAQVDSVIFRLRATDQDADFPLIFEIIAKTSPIVRVENLPCTLYNKVCQANVILTRRLIPGRLHDFIVRVRDSAGDVNSMQATISVTNSTTPRDKIFPYVPSLIMVPENTKPEKELDYLLVESNPWSGKPVYIELWQPKELFKIRQRQMGSQTKGIITLIGDLDFETQSMYTLTMYATDPYTEPGKDTRNIAGLHIVVIVQDVQDVPPVFTLAPPLTKINNTAKPGDLILRVHAEDGDKGVPRDVTYGLISEGNPFTPFFNVSETTGEIFLARPLEELTKITHVGAPIILKIVAEEVRTMRDEPPAQATIVELGILLGEPGNSPPYFENENYVAWMDENAESGTTVIFSETYSTLVRDEDIGKAGVFALKLENNNGTFEISPTVAERTANFIITVRDNTLIDYEKFKSLRFRIVAQEVGPATNLSSSVPVTIFLRDVNDNPPIFDEPVYEVTLAENTIAGTRVVQVHATDNDVGYFGRIQYMRIIGDGSEAFDLNEDDGLVTVSMSSILDREQTSKLELIIEARDEEGRGLRGNTTLIVNILDINDNAPVFEKGTYEFLLNSELTNFTMPAFVKATDADAEPPNNIIRYEIVHGNYDSKFKLNEESGELTLIESIENASRARRSTNFLRMTRTVGSNSKNRSNEIEILDFTRGSKLQDLHISEDYTQSLSDSNDLSRKRRADSDPLFILTARAYDLGVPHLSSTTQIRIMRSIPALARTVMFVMPGENPDPTKTAETLATITGSRVTIQEIKPYLHIESDNTADSTRRSVVVAQVEQSGPGTLVDVEKIRESLAANGFGVISGMDNLAGESSGIPSIGGNPRANDLGRSSSKNISAIGFDSEDLTVYKAENKLLTWLLILLGLLVLAAVITLITCCICPSCPFYMEPRKRRIHSSETLIFRSDERPKKHLYRKPAKMIDGHFSHYYSERKEAWSADPAHQNWYFNRRNKELGISSLPGDVATAQHRDNNQLRIDRERRAASLRAGERTMYLEDVEAQNRHFCELDSLKRHEIERGSDAAVRNGNAIVADDPGHDRRESVREQHFYRDGNAEVLMLVTRGEMEDQNEVAHPTGNLYHANGKDILLQRFIEDQKLRRDHDLRDSLQGSHPDEDIDRSMDSHHRARDNREILILPEKLEMQRQPIYIQRQQRQNNSTNADTRISIPDQLYKSTGTKNATSDIGTQEDSRMFTKGVHQMAADYPKSFEVRPGPEINGTEGTRHVELARQNALLTRLLLEREGKILSIPGIESSNLLETQSLPGVVAIATQTDSTTATQTEFILRSRSDNEDLEDEYGLRYKTKYRGKFETSSDVHKMKTIWVSAPIPEENRTQTGQKSTPTRTRIEVMESKKISVSPDYLKDTSTSPKSDESCDNPADRKGSTKRFESKSDRFQNGAEGAPRNKVNTKTKRKAPNVVEESTTTSPETKETNSKSEIRKRPEKPPRLKRTENSKTQDSLSYIEPSFRVLEREISNFQRKIRKLGSEKIRSIERKEFSVEGRELKSSPNKSGSPKKIELMVNTDRKIAMKRTNPTKISVQQKLNTSEEEQPQGRVNSGQDMELSDSDQGYDEVRRIEAPEHDTDDPVLKSGSRARNRTDFKKQSAVENSDSKSSEDRINKSDGGQGRDKRSSLNLPPLSSKTSSDLQSLRDSDENTKNNQQKIQNQNENNRMGTDTTSIVTNSSKLRRPLLKSRSLGGVLKKTIKKNGRSLPQTSDESKLTSPLKSDGSQRSSSKKRSSNNESAQIDFEKLVNNVKGAVEREFSSFTQAARDAFTFQKSGYSVIGNSSGKSEYLLSPKKKQKEDRECDPDNVERDSNEENNLEVRNHVNANEDQENGRSLKRRKSKSGSKDGKHSEQSDDAISFIVIEKNETALGASDHGKIFHEPNDLKNKKNDSRTNSRKSSTENKLDNSCRSKTEISVVKSEEMGSELYDRVDNTRENATNDASLMQESNDSPTSQNVVSMPTVSDNIREENSTIDIDVQDTCNHSKNDTSSGKSEDNLRTKAVDDTQITLPDQIRTSPTSDTQELPPVAKHSDESLIQQDLSSSSSIPVEIQVHREGIQKKGADENLVKPASQSHSSQNTTDETMSSIHDKSEFNVDQIISAEDSNDSPSPKNDGIGGIALEQTQEIQSPTQKVDQTVDPTKTDQVVDSAHVMNETVGLVTCEEASQPKNSTEDSVPSPVQLLSPDRRYTDPEPPILDSLETKAIEESSIPTENGTDNSTHGTNGVLPANEINILQPNKLHDPADQAVEVAPKTDDPHTSSVTQDTTENSFVVIGKEEIAHNQTPIELRVIGDTSGSSIVQEIGNIKGDDSESSSGSSSISNKTALHVTAADTAQRQNPSSVRANGVSSIPKLKVSANMLRPEGKTRQKWNTPVDRDPVSTMETQSQEETSRTYLQNKIRLPPMTISSSTIDKSRSGSSERDKSLLDDNRLDSDRFIKSYDSKISKTATSKSNYQSHPSNHRPVVVAVKRKENHQPDPTPSSKSTHESHQTSNRLTEIEDHSTSEQHKVEIRSKHLKLHVSHHYRRTRDEVSEEKNCQENQNKEENHSKPVPEQQHRKDPEVANARSRYMAWYQQKRAEMEKKRKEKKEAEELLFRPKGCRGPLNGSKLRKAKSAPDDSGQVTRDYQKSSGPRERTKSTSAEDANSRINRLQVKPLVNVESEQLKAIVRQGRKLRRAEGREEDHPVQIFAPSEKPALAIIAHPGNRHHLTQHSEYKFEKAVTAALPFYLHPPPVPHPSPEHCQQDDSSDGRRIDDDLDSGIAVSLQGGNRLRHQQLLEKKTVFDIAYNEASPSHLRSDSSTPPS
ncbi:hypothetical protein QAD02_010607 [Eretmocerus hayati]|uniref:Uncharacterized protein n=1 Tax=Eretmocerus hayati TaxID=131215 RepID=A0ACC2NVK8_9HYME|nr:hypothetical protein QAD02_010607 [Eretmocerus hayati]